MYRCNQRCLFPVKWKIKTGVKPIVDFKQDEIPLAAYDIPGCPLQTSVFHDIEYENEDLQIFHDPSKTQNDIEFRFKNAYIEYSTINNTTIKCGFKGSLFQTSSNTADSDYRGSLYSAYQVTPLDFEILGTQAENIDQLDCDRFEVVDDTHRCRVLIGIIKDDLTVCLATHNKYVDFEESRDGLENKDITRDCIEWFARQRKDTAICRNIKPIFNPSEYHYKNCLDTVNYALNHNRID